MDDIVEYLRVPPPATALDDANHRQGVIATTEAATARSSDEDENALEILRKLLHDKSTLAALLRLAGKR